MEEENRSQIAIGNLYDINKTLVSQMQPLTEGDLNSKKEIIKNFIMNTQNSYYMLLCNERKDYTVFDFNLCGGNVKHNGSQIKCANCLIDECLKNRGEIRAIDLTKDKQAIEIWLMIDEEIFAYYFFPYDNGVIADF